MSVYKKIRRDGTNAWFYDFSINGVRYRAVGGTTQTQALRSQEKVRDQVLSGEYELVQRTKNPRVENFATKFLERRKDRRSWKRDELSVRTLLKFFKGKTLSAILPAEIEDYKIKRRNEGVSNATINRELSCLKCMFNMAIKWGEARKNPVVDVDFLEEPPGRTRYLTADEVKKLLACAPEHLKNILITALNTGMRHGEVVGLTWDKVFLEKTIHPYFEVQSQKTNKKRTIPLNDTMCELMHKLKEKTLTSKYVFLSMYGKPLKRVTKTFYNTLKRAEIDDFKFHDLRHTFASHFIMNGGDLLTLKQLLGHSSFKMVERYTHLASEFQRNQLNNLSSVLSDVSIEKNKQVSG
jgi:site-specific recombinase XerD